MTTDVMDILAAAFLLALGVYVVIRLVRSGRSLRLALALASDVRSSRPLSQYDLFISYRGTTIHTVRPVVDALQAAGITVWLDEYDVLLEDYDEERLRECIEQGIARCRRAVVFKNQEYLESAYCRRELQLLSERPELSDKVLEIWPGGVESHILASHLDRIWRFIGRDGLAPTVPDLEIGKRFFESRLAGHRFDITGWTVHQAERYEDPGTIFGPIIRRSIFGWRTHMNLIIEPLGQDSIAEWKQRHDLEESVKFFDYSRDFARGYFRRHPSECLGVHRVHVNDMRQVALSYRLADQLWISRRYSVILAARSGSLFEFVFVFAFLGPWSEYLKAAVIMDRVVQSLRWPGTSMPTSNQHVPA